MEASAQEAQVLLYGTAEQVRETRIKLGLAKLPPPPVPPNVNAPVNNDIDRFIIAKWQAAHLDTANHPPELCDDATFARRVYLDLIGVIPTIDQLTKFLDDQSPDKRNKLIDALLARNDDYAANFTPFFDEAIASSPFETQGGVRSHGNYEPWIIDSLKTNRPYDVMVAQLIDPTEPGYQKHNSVVVLGKTTQVGYIINDTPKDTLQSAANFGGFFLGTAMRSPVATAISPTMNGRRRASPRLHRCSAMPILSWFAAKSRAASSLRHIILSTCQRCRRLCPATSTSVCTWSRGLPPIRPTRLRQNRRQPALAAISGAGPLRADR